MSRRTIDAARQWTVIAYRSERFRKGLKRFVAGLAVASVLFVGCCYYLMFVRVTGGDWTNENELHIPVELFGKDEGGTLQFELRVDEGTQRFFDGIVTSTAGANGSYLGPTLRMRRGDMVDLHVENLLEEETTMHWHGMHVPARMDGTPHQKIMAGKSWTASFEVDQQAATLWYHPHTHGNTGRQAYSGIAGLLLIDDENSDSLELPKTYGVDDIPLIIQDRRFDESGDFEFVLNQGAVYGDHLLVNGTIHPFVEVESRLIRFRLLNASNARIYHIGFEDNRDFDQIATDGGFLETPCRTNRIVMAPGERAEILVDFRDGKEARLKSFPEAGILQTAEAYFDGAGNGHFQLLRIQPKPTEVVSHEVPATLNQIARFQEQDAAITRPMLLGGFFGPGQGRQGGQGQQGGGQNPRGQNPVGLRQNAPPINGKRMEMHRIDEVVRVGDVEIWNIVNRGGQPHPFHVHLVQFQILDRNGQPPIGAERGWKDTVLVHPGDQVRIIMSFDRYADSQTPYMYHCHIMEHEDRGMMGQFLVVEEPEQLDVTQGQPTVVLFIVGFTCEHCLAQVQKFDEALERHDVNLLVVTPEPQPNREWTEPLRATVVSDPEKRWAGWLGLLHDGPAHGTYLLDRHGKVAWGDDSDTPLMDIDVVVEHLSELDD